MKRPTLYLLCGLPGAGKTTRSKQIAAAVDAVYVAADEWVLGLGKSLVDYEFRARLEPCLLAHAGEILRCGASVILEFGSWSRDERSGIRQVAERAGALTELHFLQAPLEELVRRARARGGPDAETLTSVVLLQYSGRFQVPTPEETALFDRYVGPAQEWTPL